MDSKISFTSGFMLNLEKLDSFVLEAAIDNQDLATVCCLDGQWQVTMNTADNQLVTIS